MKNFESIALQLSIVFFMSVRDLPVSMHVLSDSYNYKTIALPPPRLLGSSGL